MKLGRPSERSRLNSSLLNSYDFIVLFFPLLSQYYNIYGHLRTMNAIVLKQGNCVHIRKVKKRCLNHTCFFPCHFCYYWIYLRVGRPSYRLLDVDEFINESIFSTEFYTCVFLTSDMYQKITPFSSLSRSIKFCTDPDSKALLLSCQQQEQIKLF